MAKVKNELVQFAGHFQSLVGEISQRLNTQGVNIVEAISRVVQPENTKVLDEISNLLGKMVQTAKNIFRLTKTEDGRTTEELVRDGNYNYANPNITSKNFPIRRMKNGTREIVLLEFDHDATSEEAIVEAEKQGLERPVYEDALYFGVEHPGVQREYPVVFLHEPWLGSFGGRYVLCLWGDADDRKLGLDWFDSHWFRHCRFAFVRKLNRTLNS